MIKLTVTYGHALHLDSNFDRKICAFLKGQGFREVGNGFNVITEMRNLEFEKEEEKKEGNKK